MNEAFDVVNAREVARLVDLGMASIETGRKRHEAAVLALVAEMRKAADEIDRLTAENKALSVLNREWTGEIQAQALLNERKPFEQDIEKYARKLEEAWSVNARLTAERDVLQTALKTIIDPANWADDDMDNNVWVNDDVDPFDVAETALRQTGGGK